MIDEIDEIYDYEVLRRLEDATMFVVHPSAPLLVLGGNQSPDVLNDEGRRWPIRRRRGGGGVVALAPEDLWIDFWIPREDPRWRGDVRAASVAVGEWWSAALREGFDVGSDVHRGGLEGDSDLRVACFAGRGPGEVFVDDRKVVGVTQWHVREGNFLSTVLRATDSRDLVNLLREPRTDLTAALTHHDLHSLGVDDAETLTANLRDRSGPWRFRRLGLSL
ncbi:MAG: hypothetical protein KGJ42_02775 [Acidobacteriota bacterium]|nr:hypothetical protein [Acidobacteriota bacterium]